MMDLLVSFWDGFYFGMSWTIWLVAAIVGYAAALVIGGGLMASAFWALDEVLGWIFKARSKTLRDWLKSKWPRK